MARMKINWKKWPHLKWGDTHLHMNTWPDTPDYRKTLESSVRYAKGHYVVRPYFEYATSKWENSYPDLYEVLLQPIKHKPVTFLELGVYTGESIRYFRDFFTNPDTKIVGFDYNPCEFFGHDFDGGHPYSGPRHNVFFEMGNQNNDSDVRGLGEKFGSFDVIMDDANHDPELTEKCVRILWPYLKEEGLYLIEDIGEEGIAHLLDEMVVTNQGKGFYSRSRGFGPRAGAGGCLVLLKTKDRITGLDETLVE